MNTPNKITVLRILLVPVFVFFLLENFVPYNLLIAGIIFAVASFTDHLDGKIARSNNQVTNFGKFLDPLADKILVISAFVCFVELGFIGAVPVIIILMREFMVTSVRLMAANSGKVVAANFWGKAKTVSQIVAVLIILLLHFIYGFSYFTNVVSEVLVWVSVLLTVISGTIYLRDNINFIKS